MKLPTTSYAILGLLSINQMSGYELAQAADRSIANFWPISRSQVYGELGRLEQLGFVTGTDVAQQRLPDKRVFTITGAGHEALADWLAVPTYERDRMRLGFCVKLFFGHQIPRETLVKLVESFRDTNRERATYLDGVVRMLSVLPETAFVRATALLGQRVSEAAAAWADELLDSLPEVVEPKDPAEHERLHAKARELFEKAPPRSTI